jgi:phosphoribosylformylglycinamidine synthase
VLADPHEGGKQAVAEAWRNLTAVGALPIAVTDNLNFGNPEKPEVMGQIVRAIEGMARACRALDFPVVSGNVSLYNETLGVAIPPTPTVGAVGLIEDYAARAGFAAMRVGDTLLLVGEGRGELGSSLYLRECLGRQDGAPPPVDLDAERRNGDFVRGLIRERRVRVVHDLSDGGLIIAAAEMALASGVGLTLDVAGAALPHATLFGEDQGRYLIAADAPRALLAAALAAGVPMTVVGRAGGEAFAAGSLFTIALSRLRDAHEGWMPAYMNSLS